MKKSLLPETSEYPAVQEFLDSIKKLREEIDLDQEQTIKCDRIHLANSIKSTLIYINRVIGQEDFEELSDIIACWIIEAGKLGYLKNPVTTKKQ